MSVQTSEKQFRFEDLEIWKRGVEISYTLFRLAKQLEERRAFEFASQLRRATLSITNNIAEGPGSVSRVEFANFLNISRRSVFEVANILLILVNNEVLTNDEAKPLLIKLEQESRMILAFRRRLKT